MLYLPRNELESEVVIARSMSGIAAAAAELVELTRTSTGMHDMIVEAYYC